MHIDKGIKSIYFRQEIAPCAIKSHLTRLAPFCDIFGWETSNYIPSGKMQYKPAQTGGHFRDLAN